MTDTTEHIRFTRGQTYAIRKIVRDANGRPLDLTGGKLYLAMRPDLKAANVVKLTSLLPASLDLGTVCTNANSVLEVAASDNEVLVTMVGDASGAITIAETLVTSGLEVVNKLVTIHFKDGVSTVANLEAAIAASSTLLRVKTAGTPGSILAASGDAFSNQAMVAGAPLGWRTGIVISTQTGATIGEFTATLIPSDTAGLVALGDDDPWLYDLWLSLGGNTYPIVTTSRAAIYPEITDLP